MEVRRAILQAQRQHQSTAGTSASAGEPFERDRKTSQTSKVERGLTRRGTSRERLGTKDKGVTRSPLHTLESSNLPEEDPLPSDRSGFIFYSDDGGYRATDDMDKEWQGGLGGRLVIDGKIVSDEEAMEKGQGRGESDGEGVVYYLGVIDILTKWNFMKKVEHFYKGLKADRVGLISCGRLGVNNLFSAKSAQSILKNMVIASSPLCRLSCVEEKVESDSYEVVCCILTPSIMVPTYFSCRLWFGTPTLEHGIALWSSPCRIYIPINDVWDGQLSPNMTQGYVLMETDPC